MTAESPQMTTRHFLGIIWPMTYLRTLFICAFLLLGSTDAKAQTDSPLPKWGSIGADIVNVRTGPGTRYPVAWTFKQRGHPIKVIAEFGMWFRIEDIEGEQGWIYRPFYSSRRTALVVGADNAPLYADPKQTMLLAYLEPGVVVSLEGCKGASCEVRVAERKGWVNRGYLGMLSEQD